ncbi:hypothetical protein [Arcobacter roscoffensis]|uniref:Uncharacterized protein n=1 Tax=Arcobacter roscoffensis TaxID=2961520 RepID=A0ABY5E3B8_9BACT|nr:hypothetical protein [Arcobacter roscoffensis]UTJ06661.1 hypothetical protein NJU99_00800 [Arcobacter roscoffensis]
MIKAILILLGACISLNANPNILKHKNVLYVQNLIKKEEKIALAYENYLLNEFKIPSSISDLMTSKYLGENFDVKNPLGENIEFKANKTLKYALIRKGLPHHLRALYYRDVYRNRTSVRVVLPYSDSYITISLKDEKAKTIFNLLDTGNTISKTCENVTNAYCNKNEISLRWIDSSASDWIEYDKEEFNLGNVTVSNKSMLNNTKLNSLAVGRYIYVQNSVRYIKLINNEIKEVD